MNCDEVRERTDAYALGALEPAEREAVERHIAGCASCGEHVDRALTLASRLALAVPIRQAPPELHARLMREVAHSRSEGGRTAAQPARVDRGRDGVVPAGPIRPAVFRGAAHGGARLATIAAAAAAIVVVIGAAWIARLQFQVNRLEKRSQALQLSISEVEGQRAAIMLLASNGSSRLQMEPTIYASGAQGTVIWNPDRKQCSVLAAGLPPAGSGYTYHVWLVSGNRSWDHGELAPGPGGTVEKTIELPQLAAQRPYQIVVSLQPNQSGKGDWHPVLRAWVDSQ